MTGLMSPNRSSVLSNKYQTGRNGSTGQSHDNIDPLQLSSNSHVSSVEQLETKKRNSRKLTIRTEAMSAVDEESSQSDSPRTALKKGGSRSIPFPGEPQPKKPEKYGTNYISTTKYTLLSFLPLGLLYQFYRFSNCFFLFVTIL